MAASIETSTAGEGNSDSNPVRSMIESKGITLLEETYDKLNAGGFVTIERLTAGSVNEMMVCFKEELQINAADRMLLKRVLNELGNKKHFVDPEELSIAQSMALKLKKLENMINNLSAKQSEIEKEQAKVERQINTEFDRLIDCLKKRKQALLKQLSEIVNSKNQRLKADTVQCQNTMERVSNIKQDTDALLDTPVSMDELKGRKSIVIENQTQMNHVIDAHNKSKHQVSAQILFAINMQTAIQAIGQLGLISDVDVPILKELVYNNDAPDGRIKVQWQVAQSRDNHHSASSKRKMVIEYAMMESKENDQDDSQTENLRFHANDDAKYESVEVEMSADANGGSHQVKVEKVGVYIFKLKYCFVDSKLCSPYSNIKSVRVDNIVDLFADSTIVEMKEKRILTQWMKQHVLKNDVHKKMKLCLLYRMSRDGRDLSVAKPAYCNKGATLTIMQSRDYNHVCGGYTSKSWNQNGSGYESDPDAFIFLLRSQFGHSPKILKPKQAEHAIYHYSSCGPSWGHGSTLCILPCSSYDVYSCAEDGSYDVSGNELLGGTSYQQTSSMQTYSLRDYEVYQVVIEE